MSRNTNRLRHARPTRARVTVAAAVALATALSACTASAPRWSAAQPSVSQRLDTSMGSAIDCGYDGNVFGTPDAMKLPLSSCRGG